ncbi:LysR family transcriptional regulator [Agrococcus sp. SGAir0287]|uniref:LysR family transcriptional regulator n=1 Tax=Agrococcus sp. SGAir0287 TaxID=2070347 RepID=UPI0015865884|nr:LysR family transcriptional regulator [Agrococcus sp. SGAir0287]
MLDLPRLVILRAVQLHGGITAAARELQYSHSAVSQQLSVLEREVGVPLLERRGRTVGLTAAGIELVRSTEAILAAVERAEADLARSQREPRGVVTIAAFASIARSVLPLALRRLAVDAPHLEVHVELHVPEEAAVRLAARQVDAVLTDAFPGTEVPEADGIHATPLTSDRVRGYLPAGTDAADLAALREVPWVLEPVGAASRQWALRVCREQGFEPRIAHVSSDILFHLRMAEAGLAAAFVPDLVVREAASDAVWSDALPSGDRGILFLVRSGAEAHPALVAIRDAVRAAIGEFEA